MTEIERLAHKAKGNCCGECSHCAKCTEYKTVEIVLNDKSDEVKLTERGWAGHYIASRWCWFHRNTLIEYKDKKWIVSTIGRQWSDIENKFITIGLGRYYETFAYVATTTDCGYIDCDFKKQIKFESKWAIEDCDVDSEMRANDMHDSIVKELSKRIVQEGV